MVGDIDIGTDTNVEGMRVVVLVGVVVVVVELVEIGAEVGGRSVFECVAAFEMEGDCRVVVVVDVVVVDTVVVDAVVDVVVVGIDTGVEELAA